MKKFCTAIVLLSVFISLHAQWTQLKNELLSSTRFEGIVYTGTSVLIANEGGIFRSTDNGLTWNLSVNGLDTLNTGAWDITRISSRNEIWITGNGVYKSTDDGLTWNRATLTGIAQYGWSNNISRIGNKLVIIYSHWNQTLSRTETHLCYSDNGVSWSYGALLSTGDQFNWQLIEDENENILYFIGSITGSDPKQLWFTTDALTVNLHPSAGLPSGVNMYGRSFAVDPQGNNLFFRDESGGKYYRYNKLTSTWEEKMNGIGGSGWTVAMVFDIHALGSHTFGAAYLFNALSEVAVKLYYSSDAGDNWLPVADPGIDFPFFEGQMIIAGNTRIIGNYFGSDVCYSDDTGQTWTKVNSIFSGEFDDLSALPSGNLFTTTIDQSQGLLRSTDNGATWEPRNGNLDNFAGIYFIEDLMAAGNALYLTSALDPSGEKLYLFKSTDEGATWTKLTSTPDVPFILFAGRNGANPICYFGDGEGNGTIQMTTDGGSSWVNLTPAIGPLGLTKIQGIKGNGSIMMLFGEKAGRTRIYMSNNNGVSFIDITSNLDAINLQILISDKGDNDKIPSSISSFSSDGTAFYVAAINNNYPFEVNFYRLNEAMTGWIITGTEGIEFPYSYVNWQSLKHNSGVWYFVNPAGVYASIDNCTTWKRIWKNEGFQKGIRTTSSAITPYGIFVGTSGTGIWRAPLTQPEFTTRAATDITDVSAVSGADISSTGGLPFISKGICWAEHSLPETTDNVLYAGSTWSDFTVTMQPLSPATTYYARSFISGPKGLKYGNEISFTTEQTTGMEKTNEIQVKIFPNPSQGIFNISSGNKYMMTLMDISGKVIINKQINPGTERIELKGIPSGVYFIRLAGDNNEVSTFRHIIK